MMMTMAKQVKWLEGRVGLRAGIWLLHTEQPDLPATPDYSGTPDDDDDIDIDHGDDNIDVDNDDGVFFIFF